MILVDIQVPEIDGIYDFELDEDMAAGEAARAAAELTALWEGIFAGESMSLYARERGIVLKDELTLRQQGLGNGERLILF